MLVALAGAFWLLLAGWAGAGTEIRTLASYYRVSGQTAEAIYRSILRHGPNLHGQEAFAITRPSYRMQGTARMEGGMCRMHGMGLYIDFAMTLPRHADTGSLSPGLRLAWKHFSQHILDHERRHVRIWRSCAEDAEARLRRLSAPDCGQLDQMAAKIIKQMEQSCAQRHDAFDKAEAKSLPGFKFMRMVRAGN